MTDARASSSLSLGVVICAYTEERWELTLKAIESVRRQTVPVKELVVVIDHNPTLFERFRKYDSSLRVLENQEVRGLSGGRNTGIAATCTDIIGFLDDDAEAPTDWAEILMRHFARPEVVGVGSRVDPVWIGQPQAWFPAEFLWTLGCSYLGLPLGVSAIRNISGTGMFVRRSVFETIGGFSHKLGRTDSKLPYGGEETELCIRARRAISGSLFIYEPNAWIAHHVSTERMTWGYLCRRCYAEGLSKATMSKMVGAGSLTSERRQTLVVLPKGLLKGLADTVLRFDLGGLGRAFAILLGFGSAVAGYAVGWVQLRISPPCGVDDFSSGP